MCIFVCMQQCVCKYVCMCGKSVFSSIIQCVCGILPIVICVTGELLCVLIIIYEEKKETDNELINEISVWTAV